MPTTDELRKARWTALHDMCNVLDSVSMLHGVEPAFMSNPYVSDRERKLAMREWDKLRWQLRKKLSKIENQLYS